MGKEACSNCHAERKIPKNVRETMTRNTSSFDEAFVVLEILKRIPRDSSRVTAKEILQSLNESGIQISERSLQRCLKALSEDGRFHVECDKREKPYGYRILKNGEYPGEFFLQPSECLLLELAKQHLAYQIPEKLSKSFDYLFNRATDILKDSKKSKKQKNWLNKIAILTSSLARIPPNIKPRIFEAVSNALYEDRKLRVTYCNTEGKKSERIVTPLALVQQDQRIYLVCQYDGFSNFRHLALHRFLKAEVTDFSVDVPKDFDLKKYTQSTSFNYGSFKKIHLTIEFSSPVAALNLKETPFNETQTLVELEDGFYRLEVDMVETRLLDGWIAMWKDDAGMRLIERKEIPTETTE